MEEENSEYSLNSKLFSSISHCWRFFYHRISFEKKNFQKNELITFFKHQQNDDDERDKEILIKRMKVSSSCSDDLNYASCRCYLIEISRHRTFSTIPLWWYVYNNNKKQLDKLFWLEWCMMTFPRVLKNQNTIILDISNVSLWNEMRSDAISYSWSL